MYASVTSTATVLDQMAKYSGLLRWMRSRCAQGVTILMYHRVLPARTAAEYPLASLVVDETSFADQMAWLASEFEVRPLRDAVATTGGAKARGPAGSRPVACVTFDDGYLDNCEVAAPILERFGLRATFFVTTGFVQGAPLWFDIAAFAWNHDREGALRRLSEVVPERAAAVARDMTSDAWFSALKAMPDAQLKALVAPLDAAPVTSNPLYGAMTPDQLKALSDRGHEIASHSVTHPILTNLDDAALAEELEASRRRLSDWTGRDVEGLCYPNGNHDARVRRAAQSAGFRYACSTARGIATPATDPFALPRRGIHPPRERPLNLESFESEVVGCRDLMRNGMRQMRQAFRIHQ